MAPRFICSHFNLNQKTTEVLLQLKWRKAFIWYTFLLKMLKGKEGKDYPHFMGGETEIKSLVQENKAIFKSWTPGKNLEFWFLVQLPPPFKVVLVNPGTWNSWALQSRSWITTTFLRARWIPQTRVPTLKLGTNQEGGGPWRANPQSETTKLPSGCLPRRSWTPEAGLPTPKTIKRGCPHTAGFRG